MVGSVRVHDIQNSGRRLGEFRICTPSLRFRDGVAADGIGSRAFSRQRHGARTRCGRGSAGGASGAFVPTTAHGVSASPTWIPSAARRWLSPAVSRVPASGRRGAGGAVRPSSLPPLAVQV